MRKAGPQARPPRNVWKSCASPAPSAVCLCRPLHGEYQAASKRMPDPCSRGRSAHGVDTNLGDLVTGTSRTSSEPVPTPDS
jgi:hypothetical protein